MRTTEFIPRSFPNLRVGRGTHAAGTLSLMHAGTQSPMQAGTQSPMHSCRHTKPYACRHTEPYACILLILLRGCVNALIGKFRWTSLPAWVGWTGRTRMCMFPLCMRASSLFLHGCIKWFFSAGLGQGSGGEEVSCLGRAGVGGGGR